MDIAHFLLTRFNVAFGFGNVPSELGLKDDWLEHRFALFENFCLPSVLAQEHKKFSWLIWIDERMPERWKTRLKTDLARLASAHLLPVQPGTSAWWQADLNKMVAQTTAPRIVTTRLDNDDAISRD